MPLTSVRLPETFSPFSAAVPIIVLISEICDEIPLLEVLTRSAETLIFSIKFILSSVSSEFFCIETTVFSISPVMFAIISPISVAAVLVLSESVRISPATTEKPLPCSPARDASMDALIARMFVCREMSVITFAMPTIWLDCSERLRIISRLSSVLLQTSLIEL